jgi:hypothetical protein
VTATSKYLGLKSGSLSGKRGIELALKNNEMYIANLKAGLYGMPNRVLAALAASALDMAIDKTKHDSSRFAANWNLSISGRQMFATMDPSEYNQHGTSYGSVGKKRSGGSHKEAVLVAKSVYWGYTRGANNLCTVSEGGRLFTELGLARRTVTSGPPVNRKVELYNPVTSSDFSRIDGFGNTYAKNALTSMGPAVFMSAATAQRIGSAVIPLEIQRITQELRWMSARRQI